MSKVIEEHHYSNFTLRVHTPDGLYIPLESPITDEEKALMNTESELVSHELMMYLVEKLRAIGVIIDHIGLIENYTIQTSKV